MNPQSTNQDPSYQAQAASPFPTPPIPVPSPNAISPQPQIQQPIANVPQGANPTVAVTPPKTSGSAPAKPASNVNSTQNSLQIAEDFSSFLA